MKGLTTKATAALLRKLSRDQFGLAIKAADEELRDLWYSYLSDKARAMIQEDHRVALGVTQAMVSRVVDEVIEIAARLDDADQLD